MKVTKLYFNDAKEQKWFNQMSASGWHVVDYKLYTLTYTFEYNPEKQYNYVIDYIGHREKDYFDFVESTGAELVFKNSNWAFFRKEMEEGPFELYTDVPTKLEYFNKLSNLYLLILFLNMFAAISNIKMLVNELEFFNIFLLIINMLIAVPMISLLVHLSKRKKDLKDEITIFE